MDATTRSIVRHHYNLAAQKKPDHNGRSGTITLEVGEWASLLAWFKILLDAADERTEADAERGERE